MQNQFPSPTSIELERSKQLSAFIKNIILTTTNEAISFAEYMRLALYTPQLGYYMAEHAIFGWQGDFTTAPELTGLFARCLAMPCIQVLEYTGGDILEIGAGSGKLAVNLLKSLPEPPQHYYIYEISSSLQQRQKAYILKELPDLIQRVIWLEHLPKDFVGLIIANEVMDALPADCFSLTQNGLEMRQVGVENDKFIWRTAPASETLQNYLHFLHGENFPMPYNSEVQPGLSSWIQDISQTLKQGIVLLIDYGFPRREYYHPDRKMGTLMGHYRQIANPDPFFYPGLQDLTVHVDFTAVAEAAHACNLEIIGFTTQAHFLIDAGLIHILQNEPQLSYAEKHHVHILTSPAEMGELFKVMALARNCNIPLAGLCGYSRTL